MKPFIAVLSICDQGHREATTKDTFHTHGRVCTRCGSYLYLIREALIWPGRRRHSEMPCYPHVLT